MKTSYFHSFLFVMLALAPACGSSSSGAGHDDAGASGGSAGAGGASDCLHQPPTLGTSCSSNTQQCWALGEGGCAEGYFCEDDVWKQMLHPIMCSTCPKQVPATGSACNASDLAYKECVWSEACDGGGFDRYTGSCDASGWSLSYAPCSGAGGADAAMN